jgi:mRNA interferase MazF
MKLGDIVVVDYPFSNLVQTKIRPAVVTFTYDKHKDIVLCLVSSAVPRKLNKGEILLQPNSLNNLRTNSVIKVYRVATVQQSKIVSKLGKLSPKELQAFIVAFQSLVHQ